jgi:AcrR family transcriptional regulator
MRTNVTWNYEMKKYNKHDKQTILTAALQLARRHGYTNVTRCQIAALSGCTSTLVPHYFGTMPQLRRAIMGEAIRTRDLTVIAQGLIAKDVRAMNLPDELKREALESLL